MLAGGRRRGTLFGVPWLQQSGWLQSACDASACRPAPRPARQRCPRPAPTPPSTPPPPSQRETLALAGARYQEALAIRPPQLRAICPARPRPPPRRWRWRRWRPAAQRDQAGADAKLRLGAILAEQGSTAEGLAALRSALSLLEAHAVMDGDKAQAAPLAVADAHRAIAAVLAGSDDAAGAETELAAARAIYAAQRCRPRPTTLRCAPP